MKSRSVFLIALLWWLLGAAAVGAFYPIIITATATILGTDTAALLGNDLGQAVVGAAGWGLLYGSGSAVVNAGLATLLGARLRSLVALTRLVAVAWTVIISWLMPQAGTHLGERVAATAALGLLAWTIAPMVHRRYRSLLPDPAADVTEANVAGFRPIHMLTASAQSSDVESFVRTSLRTRGHGNALFTLEAGRDRASTEVFVDASGTGHVLNLDMKHGSGELADGAAGLPGFLITDDRTLAIAPAGLSAAAVIAEGIGLVQSVSGSDVVKVQFEGFGH